MKPVDICLAMMRIGLWIVGGLFAISLVVGLFGPVVSATVDWTIHPHHLACESFSLDIPFSWKSTNLNCKSVFAGPREGAFFASDGVAGQLWLSSSETSFTQTDQSARQFDVDEERGFREANPDQIFVPYQLNARFQRCLRIQNWTRKDWNSVECWDGEHGVVLRFFGTDATLSDLARCIH